jgi:small subunit ribosomal protein S16
MAVRIRLSRFGRLHRPYFRIVAIDGRCHREGKANEILGSYDPLLKDKNIQVDMEKVQAWIARGALVSESLTNLLKHHGYPLPAKAAAAKPAKPAKKKPAAKAPGKKGEKQPWVAPTRRSLRKHAAKLKGERKIKTDAEVAAAAAAKAAAKPAEGAAPAEAAKT